MDRWGGDRLIAEVERLGARGLPYGDLHAELTGRIRRAFPVDAACWHGLDPDTRLLTTANPLELLAAGFITAETEAQAAGAVVASGTSARTSTRSQAWLVGARRSRSSARPHAGVRSAARGTSSSSRPSEHRTRCGPRW
jgi:hypothetical protein